MIRLVGFDADDTLWHNERIYVETQQKFTALLREYHSADWIDGRLYDTEMRNLRHFGYGIKSFTLSMIETAIELTEGRISASRIHEIIGLGRDMLSQPVDLLEGAADAVRTLAAEFELAIVTKGDLFDRESKIAQSGLGDFFKYVEVVTEKDVSTYRGITSRCGVAPDEFVMVGNSLKSDVIPVVQLGAHAVHVPYETTWKHEELPDSEVEGHSFLQAESIGRVPGLIAALARHG